MTLLGASHPVLRGDTRVALLDPPPLPERYRRMGILSPAEYQEIERIRRGRFYLVRNDGPHGERAKCGRCGSIHTFFTWMCCEQPFQGLRDALVAYVKVADKWTDPAANLRRNKVLEALHELGGSHPQTARDLAPGVPGMDALGFVIGTVEPITEAAARRYEGIIRGRDRTWELKALH